MPDTPILPWTSCGGLRNDSYKWSSDLGAHLHVKKVIVFHLKEREAWCTGYHVHLGGAQSQGSSPETSG